MGQTLPADLGIAGEKSGSVPLPGGLESVLLLAPELGFSGAECTLSLASCL